MPNIQVELLGPIRFHVKREGKTWVAAIDPFSIFGEGKTKDVAVRRATANLRKHLAAAAEEMAAHDPGKLNLFCPLRKEDKEGAETTDRYVIATYESTGQAARSPLVETTPVRELSASRLANVFKHHGHVGVPEFAHA